MTMPLLEGIDGVQKMSKSLDNYIGINDSPAEVFGKVMSISDEMMYRYFELVTDVPVREIENWRREVELGNRHPMDLKKSLAETIITDYHSGEAASAARREFERVFARGELPEDIETREEVASTRRVRIGKFIAELGLASSTSEADRLIKSGAVTLNGSRVDDARHEVDCSSPGEYLFRVGKRRFMRVVLRPAK
jgi:tyrosyl-tRNA synthetase